LHTLSVLLLNLPLRQLRSTTNLSQYTLFQGLVILTSLEKLPLLDESPSDSYLSIFGRFA